MWLPPAIRRGLVLTLLVSPPPPAALSPRERQVAGLLADGRSDAQIAAALTLTRRQLRRTQTRLMRHCAATSLPQLRRILQADRENSAT